MKTACFWFLFMCSWGGYSQLLNSNPELLFTGSSCIYSLNLDAQEAEVHVYFTDSLVEYADNLTKASDGNFYQITGGGRSGSFIVCKLDAVTYDISVEIEIPVLFQPSDDKTLVSVGDGKLYGFSWLGGDYELGYLFSYDIGQKEFEVIHHFQNKSERVNLDLVSDNQNFLYGLSTEGRITQFNISTKEFNVIGTLPNLGIEHGLLYAHDGYLYTLFSDWPNEKPDQILKISLSDGNVSEVYQDSVLGFDGFKLLEINGILYTTIYNSNNPVNPRYIGAYNLATSEFYLEQPLEGEVNSGLRNASNGSISYTTQINLGNGVYSNEINLYKPLVGRLVQADLPHGYVGLGIAEISKNLVVLSNQNGVNDVAEFDINGDSIRVVKRNYPNNGSFTLKHSLVKGNKRFCYGVTTHYGMFNQGAIFEYNHGNKELRTLYHRFNNERIHDFYQGKLFGSTDSGMIFTLDVETKRFRELFHDPNLFVSDVICTGSEKLLMLVKGVSTDRLKLVELDLATNKISVIIDFSDFELSLPRLVFQRNNKHQLWGICTSGGTYGYGGLYVYDYLIDNVSVVHEFESSENFKSASGHVFKGPDYKYYTDYGGEIYEYDSITNESQKLIAIEGKSHAMGSYIEKSDNFYFAKRKLNTANGGYQFTLTGFNPLNLQLDSIYAYPIGLQMLPSNYMELTKEQRVMNCSLETLVAYPNPTSNITTICIPDNETFKSLMMYDMAGKAIGNTNLEIGESSVSVDLSALSKGSYSIEIITNKSVHRAKVVRSD